MGILIRGECEKCRRTTGRALTNVELESDHWILLCERCRELPPPQPAPIRTRCAVALHVAAGILIALIALFLFSHAR
jgi:hypothetical protein